MQTPRVKSRLRQFRILTCFMALTKMLMKRQATFRVDMSMALKYWDEWDHGPHGLEQGYNLPTLTPRKNQKRTSNCETLTVLNACAEVFFFKQATPCCPPRPSRPSRRSRHPRPLPAQTAQRWDCNKRNAEGKYKPFNIRMLWYVLQICMPTPEIIHTAWTMGLEYTIGTSSMGMNAMTALAEAYGWNPSELLKPRGGTVRSTDHYVIPDWRLLSLQRMYAPQEPAADGAAAGPGGARRMP